MNLREIRKIIEENIGDLVLTDRYISSDPSLYEYSGIQRTKKALQQLEEIDIFKTVIQKLKILRYIKLILISLEYRKIVKA